MKALKRVSFLQHVAVNLNTIVTIPISYIATIKVTTFRHRSISDLLNFCLRNKAIFGCWQVKEEINELLFFLSKYKLKNILEIGTATGGTLFLWLRIANPDAKVVSIDLPGGLFGRGFTRIPLLKLFALPKQKLILIRGDSHDNSSLVKIKKIFNEIDFLFIDGDHSYQGVKTDFEMYSPLVNENGIIAIHDIVPQPKESGVEVSKFWNEIKRNYNYIEIVKDWNQGWGGIGVLFK